MRLLRPGTWLLLGLAALPAWAAARIVAGQTYAPRYPDVALQAGMALVARGGRVLALAAHPADLEFFAGGTLALLSRAGAHVTAAVLSAGERGAPGRRNAAEIRRREAEEGLRILGCHETEVLDLPDGGLTEHPRLGPVLQAVWERVGPERVLAPDPAGFWPLPNPDHAAAGHAAVRAALGRAALMAGRERRQEPPWLLLYGTRRPNVLVDVTEVIQEKETAVRAHRSHVGRAAGLVRPGVRLSSRLARGGTPAYYVEGFYRLL